MNYEIGQHVLYREWVYEKGDARIEWVEVEVVKLGAKRVKIRHMDGREQWAEPRNLRPAFKPGDRVKAIQNDYGVGTVGVDPIPSKTHVYVEYGEGIYSRTMWIPVADLTLVLDEQDNDPDYEAYRAAQEAEHWKTLEAAEDEAEIQQFIEDNNYHPDDPQHIEINRTDDGEFSSRYAEWEEEMSGFSNEHKYRAWDALSDLAASPESTGDTSLRVYGVDENKPKPFQVGEHVMFNRDITVAMLGETTSIPQGHVIAYYHTHEAIVKGFRPGRALDVIVLAANDDFELHVSSSWLRHLPKDEWSVASDDEDSFYQDSEVTPESDPADLWRRIKELAAKNEGLQQQLDRAKERSQQLEEALRPFAFDPGLTIFEGVPDFSTLYRQDFNGSYRMIYQNPTKGLTFAELRRAAQVLRGDES
jgi:hypothetical protein